MPRPQLERCLSAFLVIAGTGLGFWWGRNSERIGSTQATKTEGQGLPGIAEKNAPAGKAADAGGPGASGNGAATNSPSGAVDPVDAARREMLRALQAPNLTERVLLVAAAMQKMSRENWKGVLAAFEEEKKIHGRVHDDVRLLMAQHAGEVAGKEALSFFMEQRDAEATRAALTGWAVKDPVAAIEWLGKEADPETRRRFIGAAIRGLALSEPDLAIAELENIPIGQRKNYTNRFADSLIRSTGLEATEKLLGGMIQRAAAAGQLKDEYLMNVFWDFAQAKIQQALLTGQLPAVADWMNQYGGQPYVNKGLVGTVAAEYASVDPQKAWQWLEAYNQKAMAQGQPQTYGYDMLMAAWTQKEGVAAVGTTLGQLTTRPYYDRMAHRYAEIVAQQDPAAALRWVDTITDPAIKAAALTSINQLAKKKG